MGSGNFVFVGRAVPLELLSESVQRGGAAGIELFLVTGEAGIGKSRLLDELARRCAAGDRALVRGRCAELPGVPDFWPIRQIVRSLTCDAFPGSEAAIPAGSPLLDLVHAVQPAALDAQPRRFRLLADLAEWLRGLVRDDGLTLLLDDLHAVDRASARLLAFLAAELEACRLIVVATARDAELAARTSLTADLGRFLERARTLPLEPLARDEVGALARSITGRRPSARLVRALHQRSGGNPLFVRQLVEWLESIEPRPQDDRTLLERLAGSAPHGVRHVMHARMRTLDATDREVLTLAAVLGRSFQRDLLAILAKESGLEDPASRLDGLEDCGLIRTADDSPETLTFAHLLLRDAFYDELAPARRREVHAAACEAILAHRNIDLEPWLSAAAHHAQQGLHPNVLELVTRAGERALAQHAYERAADWFRSALAIVASIGGSDRHRASLEERLGTALWSDGQAEEARACFLRAMEIARVADAPRTFAAAAIGFAGRTDRATVAEDEPRARLEEALERLGPEDAAHRAEVLHRLAAAMYFEENDDAREAIARAAVRAAETVGDPRLVSRALDSSHFLSWRPGRLAERVEIARRQLEAGQRAPDHDALAFAHFNRAKDAFEAAAAPDVDLHIRALGEEAARLRLPFFAFQHAGLHATRLASLGRVAEAEEAGGRLRELGRRAGSPNADAAFATLLCGVRRAQGRLGELEPILSAIVRQSPQLRAARFLLAEAMLAAGRDAESRALVHGALVDALRCQAKDFNWSACMSSAARIAWRLADEAWAAEILPRLEGTSGLAVVIGFGNDWDGAWDYHRGRLCVLVGAWEAAEQALEASVGLHAGFGANAHLGHSWLALAELALRRRRPGDRERAERHARDARAIFADLGLAAAMEEADTTLRRIAMAGDASTSAAPSTVERSSSDRRPRPRTSTGRFRREGEIWTIAFDGCELRLQDSKGLRDLAVLLARPNDPVSATDLYGEPPDGVGLRVSSGEGEDRLLDARARRAYIARLRELQREREEAESLGDQAASERCHRELAALESELGRATGLGGRARSMPGPAERARKAVRNRIRNAIRRIERAHPTLGEHLLRSVRTGRSCAYRPEGHVDWQT
ncbi:MAG: AAA family ATPase [Myxococcota bacterium]